MTVYELKKNILSCESNRVSFRPFLLLEHHLELSFKTEACATKKNLFLKRLIMFHFTV